jgi:hypothetical protein
MSTRTLAWLLIAAAGAGCVSTEFQPGDVGALVIPLGSAAATGDEALVEFYTGILERMHEAYGRPDRGRRRHIEPDLPVLRDLLTNYNRPSAPAWARERMAGFERLANGLGFELHAARNAQLLLPDPVPAIGADLRLVLRLPALPGVAVRLGGENDSEPIVFRLSIAIDDSYPDGSTQGCEREELLRLPVALELDGAAVLQLPIELQLPAANAVRRTLQLRIDMLPGYVGIGGQPAAVRSTRLAAGRVLQHPAGIDAVRRAPLPTLRQAIQIGDSAHFAHVFLAAGFMPEADKQAAIESLIQWVRLGRDDQATVAMAALRELTSVSLPIGDRIRWLAWWAEHR